MRILSLILTILFAAAPVEMCVSYERGEIEESEVVSIEELVDDDFAPARDIRQLVRRESISRQGAKIPEDSFSAPVPKPSEKSPVSCGSGKYLHMMCRLRL